MNPPPPTGGDRPRLLFFRWTRAGQPQFLLDQLAEQLACLRLFFDVDLVDRDCDYDQECDRFQPDLVLFESGVYVGPRRVRNVHTHPDIPRLGFLNADAFDPVRAAFVSDMAEWGVDTFFTVSTAMADHTPEIADRLFTWPNFVDPAVHHDHGLPKVVPIVLTGSQARHYPWRNRVSRVLAQHYPVLSMPHFGWSESSGARRMATGSAYSRLIGSGQMAPTCGSFTRDLVRKHLEIPAAGTCLVAERTPVLEAAGYVDMVNCVFADADDVLDKVDHLFSHTDELEAITAAGHRLVHSRHTAAQRRQVRDWYDLYAQTGSAEGIVQPHPLAPLVRSDGRSPAARHDTGPPTEDRVWLRRGWDHVTGGRQAAAVRAFTGASNLRYMPEAEVGKAFAALLTGDAAAADRTIVTLLDHTDRLYGPVDPDPVQWSVHVRTLLCRGLVDEAWAALARHPGIRAPELERVRAVAGHLTGDDPPVAPGAPRASVCPLPATTWPAWLDVLGEMLVRNGHSGLARRLAGLADRPDPAEPPPGDATGVGAVCEPGPEPQVEERAVVRRLVALRPAALRPVLGERARSAARRWVTAQWLEAMDDAVEREDLDTVLVVAPSRLSLRERSLRLAAARSATMPEVLTVGPDAVETIRIEGPRTLVFLGGGAPVPDGLAEAVRPARLVVVEGILRPGVVRMVDELMAADFELVDHDGRRGGYYVLRARLGRSVGGRTRYGGDLPKLG